MTSYASIIALLKTALLLLSLAQGPNVPPALKTHAVSVANQAITAATQALAAQRAQATTFPPSQSATLLPASQTAPNPAPLPTPANVSISTALPMCPATAPLEGTFIDMESLSESQVENYFEELDTLHMKTLIINATRAIGSSCDASTYYWLGGLPDKLEKILAEADKRQMQIYIGLTSTMHQCDGTQNHAVFYEEPLATATKGDYSEAVKYIVQRFGSHTSFSGWYIPDEPNVVSWQLPLVYPYYRGLVDAIRMQSNKPILIAPYLVGARAKTTEEIAARAKQFQDNTGVDIQIWQDSVGADAISTNYRVGPDLSAYLRAIAEKIGSQKLWADIELFSYGAKKSGGWHSPASAMRLNQQLWLAGSGNVAKKVSWLQAAHMSPSASSHARRLYDSYRALYCSVDSVLTPKSYTWLTPPSEQYPDSGNELTDTLVATPLSYNDSAWVGVYAATKGNSSAQIDLGATRTVRWVSMHMLQYALAGIEFPDSMTLECSTDNSSWNTTGTWNLPIAKVDSEYVFSNDQPLGAQCRSIRVTLTGGGPWHFMSELEIVGH